MSRNNTGNPIGSKAFPDFEDNVKNLDQAVNAEADTFQDRLGKSRLTWAGMENQFESDQSEREVQFDADQSSREQQFRTFIASSGYQFAGEYAAGIDITEYNQVIRDENGEFWRVSGQVDLPYVTTGAGIPEDDALVPAGDAVLRQDLANPDKGAAMVARGVVAVGSLEDLRAIPQGQRGKELMYLLKSYNSGQGEGGGSFEWKDEDLSEWVANDPFCGVFVPPAGEDGSYGAFVRLGVQVITPEMFGAVCNRASDDAPRIQAAADWARRLNRPLIGHGGGGGYYLGSTVYLYTDCEFCAPVLFPANGDFVYLQVASDKVPTEVPFSALGGLYYGSSKVTGLPEYAVGKFIHIESDEVLTLRDNPGEVPYLKRTAFFVQDKDGAIVPSLDMTFNEGFSTQVKIFPEEARITIRLSVVESKGTGQQNGGIILGRDSVDLSGFTVRSDGADFRTLISVTANDCNVGGVHLDHHDFIGLGYAISIGLSCKTLVSNIKSVNERSNLDGRHGSLVTVRDSFFGNAGTHWGNNYVLQNCHVVNYSWSGKDLDVSGGSLKTSVYIRSDVCMALGKLRLENIDHYGITLVIASSTTASGFFQSPRKIFDDVLIRDIRCNTSSDLTLFGGGSVSYYSDAFEFPTSIVIDHISAPNASTVRLNGVSLDHSMPFLSPAKLTATNINHNAEALIVTQRGFASRVSPFGVHYTIKDCGVIEIAVDASCIERMDVKDCRVTSLRQINNSSARGPVIMHGGSYAPTDRSRLEAPKGFLSVEFSGDVSVGHGSLDGRCLFQIGCRAVIGATGYKTPLAYYVDQGDYIPE